MFKNKSADRNAGSPNPPTDDLKVWLDVQQPYLSKKVVMSAVLISHSITAIDGKYGNYGP